MARTGSWAWSSRAKQQYWAAGRGRLRHGLWSSGEYLAMALHLQSLVYHMLVGLSENVSKAEDSLISCDRSSPFPSVCSGHCTTAEPNNAGWSCDIHSGVSGKRVWILLCNRFLLYQLLAWEGHLSLLTPTEFAGVSLC